MYEGITKGNVHNVNNIFEPEISNLTKKIEINKPIKTLENTTAKNIEIVLNNSP